MKTNKFIKYIILFLVGYCSYMAIEVTYRGYTYLLMGIVGAISFILIDSINDIISWDVDILLQGVIGSAIITLFELYIGLTLQDMNLPSMWDYSSLPFNYVGVICLPFSLIWIVVSIIALFLSDSINYYVLHEEQRPYYKLFGKVIFELPKRKCDCSD